MYGYNNVSIRSTSCPFSNLRLGIEVPITPKHGQVLWHQCIDYPHHEDGKDQVYDSSKSLVCLEDP